MHIFVYFALYTLNKTQKKGGLRAKNGLACDPSDAAMLYYVQIASGHVDETIRI